MMASSFIGPLVNKFVSRDTNVTWDPNKYNSFKSGGEKVKNKMRHVENHKIV